MADRGQRVPSIEKPAVYCSSFISCGLSNRALIESASSVLCLGGQCSESLCCGPGIFLVSRPFLDAKMSFDVGIAFHIPRDMDDLRKMAQDLGA